MPELSSSAVVMNTDGRLEILATAKEATSEEDFRRAVWRLAQLSRDIPTCAPADPRPRP